MLERRGDAGRVREDGINKALLDAIPFARGIECRRTQILFFISPLSNQSRGLPPIQMDWVVASRDNLVRSTPSWSSYDPSEWTTKHGPLISH